MNIFLSDACLGLLLIISLAGDYNITPPEGKKFWLLSPLSKLQSLGSYDPTAQSLLSSSFDSFRRERGIKSHPIGFDNQDLVMANQASPSKKASLRSVLLATADLEDYQIGLAFVGKGHAEVILRHGDLINVVPPKNLDLTASPATFHSNEFVVFENSEVCSGDSVYVRVLHIRNARDGTDDLVLALEETPKVKYYRYADLYRIQTTERWLRHLALLSCPDRHRLVVEDCATFAYNFLINILQDLETRGYIDEAVVQVQQELLIQHNHIMDGSLGKSEETSRRDETLGESGHTSAVIAGNRGISK